MVTRRSAKSKGSQWEMDSEYSLKALYPNIRRLGGEGQYRQIDLIDDVEEVAVECKRHHKFSWNELKGYLDKLEDRKPEGYMGFLVFREDRQPAKVMTYVNNVAMVALFEDLFVVPFVKHKSTRRKPKVVLQGSQTASSLDTRVRRKK